MKGGDHHAKGTGRRTIELDLDRFPSAEIASVGGTKALTLVEGVDRLPAVALRGATAARRRQHRRFNESAVGRREDAAIGRARRHEEIGIPDDMRLERFIREMKREVAAPRSGAVE